MVLQARRLEVVENVFGIDSADQLLREALPHWMQGLGLLTESVEAGRPAGAAADWQPGVVIRMPFSTKLCRDGVVCAQADRKSTRLNSSHLGIRMPSSA